VAFPAIRLEKAALAEARGFNRGWMCPVIFTRTWRSGQGEDRLNEPHKAHYVKSRAGGHASAVPKILIYAQSIKSMTHYSAPPPVALPHPSP
jgi:hypothetical protein